MTKTTHPGSAIPMLSIEDAEHIIQTSVTAISATETIALDNALGRVTALPIVSAINLPPHRNSAMDGYALKASDTSATLNFEAVGVAYAGKPFRGTIDYGQCVKIMTGAVLPDNTDAVVIQENVTAHQQNISIPRTIEAGENVRQAGEDIQRGAGLLVAGKKLTPADLGLLAAAGVHQINVYRPLKVGFFSTGDELKPLNQHLEMGEIYNSNSYCLLGLLTQAGIAANNLGIVPDHPDALRQVLQKASAEHDCIISSGGVSVGDADYIHDVLTSMMGEVHFSKIAMKPGKPLTFARLGHAWMFGLPGNPVSMMTTFYLFVLPALRTLQGQNTNQALLLKARSVNPLKKKKGRADYQRGIVTQDTAGTLEVRSTGPQESHRLSSMSRANCFIVLAKDTENIPANATVNILPFNEIL